MEAYAEGIEEASVMAIFADQGVVIVIKLG